MDYFKHDINASEDDKICELLANGGYEMLGYYWRFVEYLYSRGGKADKKKLNSIAWSLHMDTDKLVSLICDFDLFCEDNDYVFSRRIVSEVNDFDAIGKRMAEIGRMGGKASAKAKGQADCQADGEACGKRTVKRAVSVCSTDGEACAKQNKENKINKEKKENKEKVFCPSGVAPNGEEYMLVDGKMYDRHGKELNEMGYPIIDFKLSKSKQDF